MIHKSLISFILSLVLLIVSAGGYYAWLAYVTTQTSQITALHTEIKQKTEDSVRIQKAKNRDASLIHEEEATQAYFIYTGDIVSFLESLQATGKRIGTKVEVVSVDASKNTKDSTLRLSLRVTGAFEPVVRTLGVFENAPVDAVLSGLTLDTQGALGSSTPQWVAATTLTVGINTTAPTATTPVAIPVATTTKSFPVSTSTPL